MNASVCFLRAFTIGAPRVRFGTKCPSCTQRGHRRQKHDAGEAGGGAASTRAGADAWLAIPPWSAGVALAAGGGRLTHPNQRAGPVLPHPPPGEHTAPQRASTASPLRPCEASPRPWQ